MAYDKNLELQEIEDYKAEQGMLTGDALDSWLDNQDFDPIDLNSEFEAGWYNDNYAD